MAVDKLVDSTQLDSDLTSVANAIRTKGGTSAQLAFPSGFVSAIVDMPSGGGDYTAGDFVDKTKPVGEVYSELTMAGIYASTDLLGIGNRTGVTKVSLPYAKAVPTSFLQGSSSISEIDMPLLEVVNNSGFKNMSALQYLVLPGAKQLMVYACQDCANLKGVDLGLNQTIASGIQGDVFKNCTSLTDVVIRTPAVWALNNVAVFANTPFASGGSGGTIYVPDSMISSYQGASNWSTLLGYANVQIKKIEGTTYETHFVDGTTIPT